MESRFFEFTLAKDKQRSLRRRHAQCFEKPNFAIGDAALEVRLRGAGNFRSQLAVPLVSKSPLTITHYRSRGKFVISSNRTIFLFKSPTARVVIDLFNFSHCPQLGLTSQEELAGPVHHDTESHLKDSVQVKARTWSKKPLHETGGINQVW
jgi:hypothetical protein